MVYMMTKNSKCMGQKLKYELVLNQAYYLQETEISENSSVVPVAWKNK